MPGQSTAPQQQSNWSTAIKEMAVGAIVFGGVGLIVFKVLGWTGNKELVAVGVCVLVGFLLPLFLLRRLIRFFSSSGSRHMRKHTGIVCTYHNLHECKSDMETDFRAETEISLLLQIGRWELGSGEPSFFSKVAKQKEAGCKIRILRASDKSPFLSKERAESLGYDHAHWVESVRQLSDQINAVLRSSKAKIEDRTHEEPYLWRIFIFGPFAYVSPYLYPHENHEKAVVYKLEAGPDSLYAVFKKYFDYLWKKYDPNRSADQNEHWAAWE